MPLYRHAGRTRLIYFPNPADTRGRVYVRQGPEGLEFRLWHADHPTVWERHGWVHQTALEKAAILYRDMGNAANPMALYDTAVARALLLENERRQSG